jgi:CRISPR-associated protein Cmr5
MMLDQKRAAQAYRDVSSLKTAKFSEKETKQYGVMALKLTALIRSAGLCQAVHFVASRVKKDEADKNKENPYALLLKHLAGQLNRVNSSIENKDPGSLCKIVREAELNEYLHLTREALAVVNWYGRLAQSELKVKLTDDVEE